MTGAEFIRYLREMAGTAKGPGMSVVYMLGGCAFFYFSTRWYLIGTPLPDGRAATLWDAATDKSLLGLLAGFSGLGLLVNRLARYGKIATLAGLARLKKGQYLTEEQFEIAKMVVLRDPSADLVLAFLRSAERVHLKGVGPPCLGALRRYAEEVAAAR